MVASDGTPAGGVAAVDRAFALLDAVAKTAEPRSLAQLASATGFYKSTILRIMASLERADYVRRLADGRYGLGPAAFRLGIAYERANPLRHVVLAILDELVAAGSESASFHVIHGPEARLCLFRVDSGHATLDRIRAGDVLPLDRGAAGRVLMAYSGAVGDTFDRIREEAFALSSGEREPGCSGMAAPVFGPDGQLSGSISLSGPSARFTDEAVSSWRPRLEEVARRLSQTLGGRPGRGCS